MKNKKRFGTSIAILAAAGLLGATAYGIGNLDSEPEVAERLTLDSSIDLDASDELGATAVAADIDEIPLQEETTESLPNVKDVVKNVMPAIVAITNVGKEEINFFGRQYERDSASTGSGIIVAKNDDELLIATNNHVVEGAEELTVCFTVDLEDEDDEDDEDKKLVSALVKGTDPASDLAVVAVKLDDIDEEVADKIGIVQLGDSDKVEIGEWAVAIGNALGYGQSVTFGIISALDREVTVETSDGTVTNNMIQTDAAINFGNSGGALLDMNGRLIGINSAKAAVTGVEGMGYAIPINTAKPIIEELMNQTTRTKVADEKMGALGVSVRNVSTEAQQIYRIPAGAQVYGFTTRKSPAKEAGVEEGDIITKLDDTKITSRDQLIDRLKYYEAGEKVKLTLVRFEEGGGYTEKEYEVTLGKRSELVAEEEDSSRDNSDDLDDEDDRYSDGYGLEDFFYNFGF